MNNVSEAIERHTAALNAALEAEGRAWCVKMKSPSRIRLLRADAREDVAEGRTLAWMADVYGDELFDATPAEAVRFAAWLVAS